MALLEVIGEVLGGALNVVDEVANKAKRPIQLICLSGDQKTAVETYLRKAAHSCSIVLPTTFTVQMEREMLDSAATTVVMGFYGKGNTGKSLAAANAISVAAMVFGLKEGQEEFPGFNDAALVSEDAIERRQTARVYATELHKELKSVKLPPLGLLVVDLTEFKEEGLQAKMEAAMGYSAKEFFDKVTDKIDCSDICGMRIVIDNMDRYDVATDMEFMCDLVNSAKQAHSKTCGLGVGVKILVLTMNDEQVAREMVKWNSGKVALFGDDKDPLPTPECLLDDGDIGCLGAYVPIYKELAKLRPTKPTNLTNLFGAYIPKSKTLSVIIFKMRDLVRALQLKMNGTDAEKAQLDMVLKNVTAALKANEGNPNKEKDKDNASSQAQADESSG